MVLVKSAMAILCHGCIKPQTLEPTRQRIYSGGMVLRLNSARFLADEKSAQRPPSSLKRIETTILHIEGKYMSWECPFLGRLLGRTSMMKRI